MSSMRGNKMGQSQPLTTISMSEFWQGFFALLPVSVLLIPYGFAVGATAIESGLSISQTIFMNMTVFAGAAQFAALSFWQDGIGMPLALVLSILAICARFIVMGAALSPWCLPFSRWCRLLFLSLLNDPNFADSYGKLQQNETDIGRFIGGGAVLWIAWSSGGAIGAIAGDVIGDLERFGIDVVMVGFFTTVLLGQWDGNKTYYPVIAAGAAAFILLNVLPNGWNVVVAAVIGGVVGVIAYDRTQ